MDKTKKIDKEYCLTDDSVNVYKYRCLTSGLLLDEFKKNPIGFYMHDRDKGVAVRWEDFRIEGSKLFAKPVVNLSHPDGENIVNQIENGFLNAASVGRIVCLEASDDVKLKLNGQTGATITKWFPREISLVDIPGNFNALTNANLVDIDDNELDLDDFVKPINKETMNGVLLAGTLLTALNLSDKSTDVDVTVVIQNLIDKAAKVDGLEKNLSDKTAEIETLKSESTTKEVQDLIAKGQSDKKVTNEMATKLKEDYATNPKGLKDLLDIIPSQTSVVDTLKDLSAADEFVGKKWDDLYASNQLEMVRQKFPDLYEKLKQEKYPNIN
ncbi:hypothetical protein [Flavobacterium sp. '19STA2R22 D10 B1']|uniref:hypothetical protein n=1 Tax=Flavobacterium aerium TaxID=3037261 RepID=UPI00278C8C8D|nr:hypothetical protein [Flavobacterium sp. '19STA2R22 D10 B1']